MQFYWLVLGILGVWRVTHLLHAEDGPANILMRFRRGLGSNMIGKAVSCFYCLSLWVSLPLACMLAQSWGERFLLWLAMSAGAILLQQIAEAGSEHAVYYEEPLEGLLEDEHVQLRR